MNKSKKHNMTLFSRAGVLCILLFISSNIFAQDVGKYPFHVTPESMDSVVSRSRTVRYAGMAIGVQNFDAYKQELLIWVLNEYRPLMMADSEWGINQNGDFVLLKKGKLPFSYQNMIANPIDVKKVFTQDNLVVINEFSSKEARNTTLAVEKAAKAVYKAFLDNDFNSIKQYIHPKKKHVVVHRRKFFDEDQDDVKLLSDNQIEAWFKRENHFDKRFNRHAARFLANTEGMAVFNTEGIELKDYMIYITDIHFKKEGNKVYLARIVMYAMRKIQ